MTITRIAALTLGAACFVSTAIAVPTTSFDANASEWSSSTIFVPGIIQPIGGSGQVNGNFTIVADAALPNIQIGLRAIERFSPTPLDNVGPVYTALAGESTPGLSTWNYDIHIDLRGSGLTFGDFVVSLATTVPNHTTPDLQAALEFAGSLPAGTLSGLQLFQTSLNPGFFASGVDPFATGTQTFDLSLTPRSDLVPAPAYTASISVVIVPEPATTLLAGLACVGGVLATRRR
ncbi:PEP-CTERM sorting domain-containing protein [Botrimarina hoheduenensis]|uniref:PEP-CTERM protein-sorting domain-containing protein n=1 Tax=Botrimarina hoheduenensis TaxID=2528000 RepID=A0A5C5W0U4_9BACT|nr:PEP-CTERM sorting domain-containing protein [Botrimarina hoheduenensis]TWT43392.1 hypothetical protein Pla111_23430 [Botrimarina hoheduenensis]